MAITVTSGVWSGNLIRKARKPGQCEYWRGASGRCPQQIERGDYYMEGSESRFGSNPFAVERYCMECAGAEARETLPS